MTRRLAGALLTIGATLAPIVVSATAFPRPLQIEPDVRFWIRIYSAVPNTEGLIHDAADLSIVYEKLAVPPRELAQARKQSIEARTLYYQSRLKRLAESGARPADAEDERLLSLWRGTATPAVLGAAAEQIRFQAGQANQFRMGLERSGYWRAHIERILAETGLPLELAALPHVESSFDPYAYSKAGAAGLWQFTRSTGQRFLKIDRAVDERLDPIRATTAAAAYFKEAYERLGSWPLALVSYNHGVNGMARAKAQLDTADIARVLREYQSPSFQFASRNFYPSFLAALEVERDAERLFGAIDRQSAWLTCVAPLAKPVPVSSITASARLSSDELKLLNPALSPQVWAGARRVPAGYLLRLPTEAIGNVHSSAWPIRVAWRAEYEMQPASYVVKTGDTLTQISSRLGVSATHLIQLNEIVDPHRLKIGQKIAWHGTSNCASPTVELASR